MHHSKRVRVRKFEIFFQILFSYLANFGTEYFGMKTDHKIVIQNKHSFRTKISMKLLLKSIEIKHSVQNTELDLIQEKQQRFQLNHS